MEKDELTSGSTWHAAGLCTQFIPSYNLMKLLQYSLDLYGSLEAETGRPVDFHRCGSVRLAESQDRLDDFHYRKGIANTLGIPFEIVPGVTSAVAAPAYAGIPVTQRGFSSTLTMVTGNEAPGKPESDVDWKALAEQKGTLVVLMGWENLASIVETLVTHGRPANTPVALVRWGTEPDQQTVVGTLQDIVGRAEDVGIGPPVGQARIGRIPVRPIGFPTRTSSFSPNDRRTRQATVGRSFGWPMQMEKAAG